MTVGAGPAPAGTASGADAVAAGRPSRRARLTALDRPAWWVQILLVVAFAEGYDGIRALHGDVVAVALRHGHRLLHADEFLHVSWGPALDAWMVGHVTSAEALSAYYAIMHLGVTSTALVVLWIHGRFYRRERNILLALSTVGLVVYWLYPAAPPRLLPGGPVDVVAQHLPFATDVEVSSANLYASMPSLHMAWALWASIALWRVSRRLSFRALLVTHSVITAFTVLATGNHYTVDVVCGALLTAGTYGAVAVVARMRARVTARRAVERVDMPAPPPARVPTAAGVRTHWTQATVERRTTASVELG